MRFLLAAAATVGLAVLLANRANAAASNVGTVIVPSAWLDFISSPAADAYALAEPDQRTTILENIFVSLDPSTYSAATVGADTAARNLRAFLDVIAHAEGADYNTLFGGGTFASFADHPRQYLTFTMGGRPITSSAAGRYQFLARTWDGVRDKLGLPDFSPASQDAGAIELIRERGALRDVQAGRFATAIDKVRRVWASLPGAGYGQPERPFTQLQAVYQAAGGTFES